MKNEISTRLQIEMCNKAILGLTEVINEIKANPTGKRFGRTYFICADLEGFEDWEVKLLVGHLEKFGHEHVEGFERKLSAFRYEKPRGGPLVCIEIDHHRAKVNHLTQYINHLKNKSHPLIFDGKNKLIN